MFPSCTVSITYLSQVPSQIRPHEMPKAKQNRLETSDNKINEFLF